MDKIGGWEKRKEDEKRIGALFGACMGIHTHAVSSPLPEDMENLKSKLHSITEAINKTWDFL